tara:strand:+ start:2834 stop:2962 length:129 start_codon:yes stop_codon:yes gene_type:complete
MNYLKTGAQERREPSELIKMLTPINEVKQDKAAQIEESVEKN